MSSSKITLSKIPDLEKNNNNPATLNVEISN